MARVLFIVPMDAERRAAVTRKAAGAFEPVILEDLPPEKRDEAWSTADVVVSMGFPREFPPDFREKARKVRMIQSLVAGVDHFPFERFPPSAIVCSNAGAYSVSVAEHAMALLLAAAKDIVLRTDEIRRGIFGQGVTNKALAGSTVVILGLGGIGSEIARRCKAFDMRVVGIARSRNARGVVDEIGTMDDLPRHLSGADAVVLALPLTRASAGGGPGERIAVPPRGEATQCRRSGRLREAGGHPAGKGRGGLTRWESPTGTSSTIFKSGRLYPRPPSTSVGCSGGVWHGESEGNAESFRDRPGAD